MSKYYSYLNTAVSLIGNYQGDQPFGFYLKKFFSLNRKYGSRDRKWIAHLCYCFFRLGKTAVILSTEDRILASLFLCSADPNDILDQFRPEWNACTKDSFEEKAGRINSFHGKQVISLQDIFVHLELSDGINRDEFSLSHLIQPDLFIRLRPGKENLVKEKLADAGISFKVISDSCLAMDNATRLDDLIVADSEAVIQDLSSQGVSNYFPLITGSIAAWDCCAASGGKSILAYDKLVNIELMATDLRGSVLTNLKKRFMQAGLPNYKVRQMDLTKDSLEENRFDLVIADLPCTGSGTWSRTPEQLYFFNESTVDDFEKLQKKICRNVMPSLKPGGHLLFATCSVFRKENEGNLSFLQDELHLQLVKSGVLAGYHQRADTLFAALLQKPTA